MTQHLEPWVWQHIEPLLAGMQERVAAIDIGAHEGEWTMPLAAHFRTVWAFEAQPQLAMALLEKTPAPVVVLPLALSDRNEGHAFTLYADSGHGSGHFDHGGINTGQPTGALSVVCLPLDAFGLLDVGFVKIDVEGMEVAVLLGAEQTIRRERPLLCIEIHTAINGELIEELLQAWGYAGQIIRHPDYAAGSVDAARHYWIVAAADQPDNSLLPFAHQTDAARVQASIRERYGFDVSDDYARDFVAFVEEMTRASA